MLSCPFGARILAFSRQSAQVILVALVELKQGKEGFSSVDEPPGIVAPKRLENIVRGLPRGGLFYYPLPEASGRRF